MATDHEPKRAEPHKMQPVQMHFWPQALQCMFLLTYHQPQICIALIQITDCNSIFYLYILLVAIFWCSVYQ